MRASKALILMVVVIFVFTSLTFVTTFAAQSDDTFVNIPVVSFKDNSNVHNLKISEDGSITTGDSDKVPNIYSGAKKYGIIVSKIIEVSENFQSVVLKINKIQSNKSDDILVEARASTNGTKWTEWYRADEDKGNEVKFYDSLKFIQYRITLIAYSTDNLPVVKEVSLKVKKVSKEEAVAFAKKTNFSDTTFKGEYGKPNLNLSTDTINLSAATNPYSCTVYATREGLIGGTTANGHIIKDTDIFVALPHRRGLCASDKDADKTYTVDITYGTKTMYNVPVWDIGPHNIYDDYWNVNTQSVPYPPYSIPVRDTWGYSGYGDLTRGYSEAYSAVISGFHGGWSSSHPSGGVTAYTSDTQPGTQYHSTKSNPKTDPNHLTKAEIDFSEGVWKGLGLTDNSFVSVKFNWVEQ